MRLLVLFILLLPTLARPVMAHAETIEIAEPDGVTLRAELFPAQSSPAGPAIVALHGCGGPYPSRDHAWARHLAALGHTVLLPDSYGSRGLGPQCKVMPRTVTASGARQGDALAALQWLAAQPGTPPGGLVLLGWSDGGSTVLAAAASPKMPKALIRGFVAFYPGCRAASQAAHWAPSAPLLILMGEADDWTPAAPCHAIADRLPGLVTLVTYPDAYHDFDAPNRPVKTRSGLTTAAGGTAHTGTDPVAREDALRRVPAFIAALPARE